MPSRSSAMPVLKSDVGDAAARRRQSDSAGEGLAATALDQPGRIDERRHPADDACIFLNWLTLRNRSSMPMVLPALPLSFRILTRTS